MSPLVPSALVEFSYSFGFSDAPRFYNGRWSSFYITCPVPMLNWEYEPDKLPLNSKGPTPNQTNRWLMPKFDCPARMLPRQGCTSGLFNNY
jgi:hypothetical protein